MVLFIPTTPFQWEERFRNWVGVSYLRKQWVINRTQLWKILNVTLDTVTRDICVCVCARDTCVSFSDMRYNVVVESLNSGARLFGFMSWFCQLLVLRPWSSYLTSWCLDFLVCNIATYLTGLLKKIEVIYYYKHA